MDLKLWAPMLDIEKDWRFEFPRLFGEGMKFRPSIDMVKKDDDLVITVELPGMAAGDVEVMLEDEYLIIKGEKTEEKEISEDDRFMRERSYGSFQRRIAMPQGMSPDKITASFDNGVLEIHVTLPEAKTMEPQKITVTTS